MTKKSFVFTPEDSESLEKLEQTWRLRNGTSVLRVSLAIFEDLTEFITSGYQLIVRSPKGEETPYNPLMNRSAHKSVPEGPSG